MKIKKPRKKMCKVCRVKFQPDRMFQPCCSITCAITYVNIEKQKHQRKVDRATRQKLKTRSMWLREAQSAFNAYIRKRDGNWCISSGRIITGQTQAGHFYTTAARPDLRFNEDNCHSQSVTDNQYKSGNIAEYRKNLIEKIGQERVDALEIIGRSDWSIDEIQEIKEKYKAKLK